jgi:hypothetical protein
VLSEPLGTRIATHLLFDQETVARHELGVFHDDGRHVYARLYHCLGLIDDYIVVRYLEDVEIGVCVFGDAVGKVLLSNVETGY